MLLPPGGRQILPGDRLITTCGYDTSADSTTVTGGHATDNEMCFNFVEYYPEAPALSYCSSGPAYNAWQSDCSGYFKFNSTVDPVSVTFSELPKRAQVCDALRNSASAGFNGLFATAFALVMLAVA
jgi:Copper type II ascorbate-dependent monooxygenase, C-terminal domain